MKVLKTIAQGIGVCCAMLMLSFTPFESDAPKVYREPYIRNCDLALTYIAYTTKEQAKLLNAPEYISPFSKLVEPSETEWTVEEEYYKEEVYEETYEQGMTYLGAYDLTAYCWTGYPCANGNYPSEGYTVACNSLPLGTVLYIDGIGYRTVEDRGADWHSDFWIDLYLGDEASCWEWGVRTRDVWIVE